MSDLREQTIAVLQRWVGGEGLLAGVMADALLGDGPVGRRLEAGEAAERELLRTWRERDELAEERDRLAAENEKLRGLLGTYYVPLTAEAREGARCSCVLVKPRTQLEPDEWEQNPECDQHGDPRYLKGQRDRLVEALRPFAAFAEAEWMVNEEKFADEVELVVEHAGSFEGDHATITIGAFRSAFAALSALPDDAVEA